MTDDQLADFLRDTSKNYMMQFYDMDLWLRQDSFDPVWAGEDGLYLKGWEEEERSLEIQREAERNAAVIPKKAVKSRIIVPCRIISESRAFGKDYRRIIVGNELMDVEAKYVKKKG